MINLDIGTFLSEGSFFQNLSETEKINFIKSNCSESWGEDIIVYNFYFEDYTIYFNYDSHKKMIETEQVEFHQIGGNLNFPYGLLADFVKFYIESIESIYFDESEEVIFLKNGINVYFNELDDHRVIGKITSKSQISRKLVEEVLTKKSFN